MSELNLSKYENVILYLCAKLGARGLRGKKKLAKLLYYIDFDRFEFEESMVTVTGDVYKRLPMGPYPESFERIAASMAARGLLEVSEDTFSAQYNSVTVYRAMTEPDMSLFDSDDLAILNRVTRKYLHLNGKELEELSHEEAPWLAVGHTEVIPFELAFYRATEFDNAA